MSVQKFWYLAGHKMVPVRVFIVEKLTYFMTSLRCKIEVEVKIENNIHNYNVRVLIIEKLNYFVTSLRGNNEA